MTETNAIGRRDSPRRPRRQKVELVPLVNWPQWPVADATTSRIAHHRLPIFQHDAITMYYTGESLLPGEIVILTSVVQWSASNLAADSVVISASVALELCKRPDTQADRVWIRDALQRLASVMIDVEDASGLRLNFRLTRRSALFSSVECHHLLAPRRRTEEQIWKIQINSNLVQFFAWGTAPTDWGRQMADNRTRTT